jgi:E3 SUMO-protein ligase PIAS1
VTIEPDGRWSYDDPTKSDAPYQNGYGAAHDDSDDDLIEVTDHRLSAIKAEFATTPLSMTRTPPLSSREASSAPRTGSKRKSEVIDLTLSDEDEEPVRPTKKVNSHQTTLNFRESSSRTQNPPSASSYTSARSFYTPPTHSYPPPTLPPPNGNVPPHHRVSNPTFATPVNVQSRYGSSYTTLDHTGSYLPPPRPSYPGQGTSSYPTYLDSSP